MSALGSRSKPAEPSGSSSSFDLSEAVDDVVDDGMRPLTLWDRKSSSWEAVEIVDEVVEASVIELTTSFVCQKVGE